MVGSTLLYGGDSFYGQGASSPDAPEVSLQYKVLEVCCGDYHTVVLTEDGTVWTQGYNKHGQLGNGTIRPRRVLSRVEGLENVVHVAAGSHHTVAVLKNGSVYMWGGIVAYIGGKVDRAVLMLPRCIKSLTHETIIGVSAGYGHTVLLSESGNAYTFGLNTAGQCGQAPDKAPVTEKPLLIKKLVKSVRLIACGRHHTCLVDIQGVLHTFGATLGGRLGIGSTSIPFVSWPTAVSVENLGLIGTAGKTVAIAAGWAHTVAVTASGSVYAMGSSSHGQVGIGPGGSLPSPGLVHLPSNERAVAVACGNFHTALLTSHGKVWVMGSGAAFLGGAVDD
eukprot:Ihof_evm9s142 gene=Ihof_evmTU9s142